MLVAPGVLAENPLRREQQHHQPDRERGLDHDQRRQQQRDHLQRPAEDRQRRAQQPARPLQQAPQQRHAQVLAGGRALGVDRLVDDP